MGVRFIIGRAGTGKTQHCLQAIRSRLHDSPVDGPKLIFLVPEQASQQMERAILLPTNSADIEIQASHRAEVLSFQRLAVRVLESATPNLPDPLSDAARVMVLRHVAATHASELRYYQRVQRHAGFLERLSATISELIQEGMAPDALTCKPDAPAPDGDPRSAAKFHDLKILYEAYLRYLGKEFLDPSQNLQLARACIPGCKWIRGAEIWMDGFASLSGEETTTLLELARHARHTEIAVLLDPGFVRTRPPRSANRSLFDRTARTFVELGQRIREAGLIVEDPLVLDPEFPPRFRHGRDLAHLEKTLFSSQALPPSAPFEPSTSPAAISLVELPSRRVEVEYAVSLICEWTRCDPPRYRYRDIAIIVRDLDPYYDLVRSTLEDRDIACFIDRRRPVAHHPLVELLRTGTMLPVEGLTLELSRIVLKTGLLPLAPESADELENHLVAHGVEGWDDWIAGDWAHRRIGSKPDARTPVSAWEVASLARINQARRDVIAVLSEWLDFANHRAGHTGIEWAQGLRSWLARLGVPAKLLQWAHHSQEKGDLDQAGEHEQTWAEVKKFLDSLMVAFGEHRLDKKELAEVIDAGLNSLSLGLVPPTVDQVLVGSIERTRHPDIKAAILLGFNDGIFPARIQEDSILNDDDRTRLIDAGVRIGLPTRERLHDESMLVYIALTRASRELVITYSRADEKNASLRPSPFVRDLLAARPGLSTVIMLDPILSRSMWDLQSRADLRRRLTAEFRTRAPLIQDRSSIRTQWNRLYDESRTDLAADPVARVAFSPLGSLPVATLSPAFVSQLFPGRLHTSVSSLESYATCPFKFFSEKILRLTERAEAPLAELDVGKVHHAIMEEFANNMVEQGMGLGQLSGDELLSTLQASCERAADRLKSEGDLPTARDAYLLRRSAARLARVLNAQQRAATSGALRPKAAELPFGGSPELNGLPALQIITPKGREITLRGFIDRVDLVEAADELLGVVVDYKDTRNKKLEYSRAYHGLSLQLLAYLLVLAEQGETLAGRPIRPAGALFISLAPRYHRVSHPDLPPTRETNLQGTFPIRGLLREDALPQLGIDSQPSAWSPFHSIYRNKDGCLGRIDSNDAVSVGTFEGMLQHTRRRMGELADGILDGEVHVHPYRLGTFSPCSWCRMNAVCRFESGLCDVQYLETLKRSEIYVRLGGVADVGSDTEP